MCEDMLQFGQYSVGDGCDIPKITQLIKCAT